MLVRLELEGPRRRAMPVLDVNRLDTLTLSEDEWPSQRVFVNRDTLDVFWELRYLHFHFWKVSGQNNNRSFL